MLFEYSIFRNETWVRSFKRLIKTQNEKRKIKIILEDLHWKEKEKKKSQEYI